MGILNNDSYSDINFLNIPALSFNLFIYAMRYKANKI